MTPLRTEQEEANGVQTLASWLRKKQPRKLELTGIVATALVDSRVDSLVDS